MKKIIDMFHKLSCYNDKRVSENAIDCISQIYIDNQYCDFKFIVEEYNEEIYVITFDSEYVSVETWYGFCMNMIDRVRNSEKLNFESILYIELD